MAYNLDPTHLRPWVRIIRDAALVVIGIFMLLHETLTGEPRSVVVGAALVTLGLPQVLRLTRPEEEH